MSEPSNEAVEEAAPPDERPEAERFAPSKRAEAIRAAATAAAANAKAGRGWLVRKDGTVEALTSVGERLPQALEETFSAFTWDEQRVPALVEIAKRKAGA